MNVARQPACTQTPSPSAPHVVPKYKVYGRATVIIDKNANFQSDNAGFSSGVTDLAAWRLPSDRSRNWNNKISSVQVN